ncbi:family 16 glycosylhydrolase [Salipiger bermudensis]|uniref:family 16 glycosylhydrolase n=1 Tax=Salipiger bermudensis TaxID=344736 RepID=UPI001CD5BA65|nr:family 16 glycosylhydrolase [Salipiger bermudensis]MCA0964033.1 family 16 glycosylhydrolase [Salipiger bermudensis]
MAVNFENYTLIIDEEFDGSKEDLNLHDGTRGLWSTDMAKGDRVHNSRVSLFGAPGLTDAEGNDLGLDPFTVESGVLSVNVSRIDPSRQSDIQAILDASPYVMAGAQDASDIAYLTGMLSLHQSWAESYGYYEVRVKMPAGTGHLTAPWLSSAHEGWPPEINMEALGRFDGSNGRGVDDAIWTNVLFNDYGIGDEADQKVHDSASDITNIYGAEWRLANQAMLDKYGWDESHSSPEQALYDPDNNEKYVYKRLVELDEVTGTDVEIHEQFYNYGIEWTPDHISFLFGTDASNMHEIFRTQTPDDVTTDMYFVLWNQFGGAFAWNPDDDDDTPFQSSLDIDSIKVYALKPDDAVVPEPDAIYLYGQDEVQTRAPTEAGTRGSRTLSGDDVLTGNALDNVIYGGSGLDQFTGGAGADTFRVVHGEGNKIITDFDAGEGDRLVLEGFNFADSAGALATLTQVGDDAWLINGAYPFAPQTIIFEDTDLADITEASVRVIAPESKGYHYGSRIRELTGETYLGTEGEDYLSAQIQHAGARAVLRAQVLAGGAGDDTYELNGASYIREEAGEGVDTVLVRDRMLNRTYRYEDADGTPVYSLFDIAAYTLGANLENAELYDDTVDVALYGNALGNRLIGNALGTIFHGGRGDDHIALGGGADHVGYRAGDGHDTILSFGADDTLSLIGTGFATAAQALGAFEQQGRDAVLRLDAGDSITLRDVTVSDLSASNLALPSEDPFDSAAGELSPPEDYAEITTPKANGNFVAGEAPARITGGAEGDAIYGGPHGDILSGLGGDDVIEGRNGDDSLFGGAGDDKLRGGKGADLIFAEAGDDRVEGGAGHDILLAGDGRDFAVGGGGNDLIYGGAGQDYLNGNSGDDVLDGGRDNDKLFGSSGRDTLDGGHGMDKLKGGLDADVFVFETSIYARDWEVVARNRAAQREHDAAVAAGDADATDVAPWEYEFLGADTVVDFLPGEDRVDLSGLVAALGIEGASQSELAEIFLRDHLILTQKNDDLMLSVDRDGTTTDDPKLIVNFARLRHVDIADFDLERDLVLTADDALLTV